MTRREMRMMRMRIRGGEEHKEEEEDKSTRRISVIR